MLESNWLKLIIFQLQLLLYLSKNLLNYFNFNQSKKNFPVTFKQVSQ